MRLEGCSRRTGNCSNRVGLSEMPASDAYDVVVIGAGAGGMTAAAVAAAEGLSVLVDREDRIRRRHDGMVGRHGLDSRQHADEAGGPQRQPVRRRQLSRRHRSGKRERRFAGDVSGAGTGGGRLPRSQHGGPVAAREGLSRLLSGKAGSDRRRPRARAGQLRGARLGANLRGCGRRCPNSRCWAA